MTGPDALEAKNLLALLRCFMVYSQVVIVSSLVYHQEYVSRAIHLCQDDPANWVAPYLEVSWKPEPKEQIPARISEQLPLVFYESSSRSDRPLRPPSRSKEAMDRQEWSV